MNRCRDFSLGAPDRPFAPWIALSLLVVLATACGFPRPPDIGDDTPPAGCSRDRDCSSPTPFCINTACAACRDSTTCPLTRPVCDMVSHDCRTCVKDSECDSGACDLAAGRCVDQGAILHASPTGLTTDPCTRTSPCSFQRAAELVDVNHAYIVLERGEYTGGVGFKSQKATIVGNGAMIISQAVAPQIFMSSQSSLTIRNIRIEEHATTTEENLQPVISFIEMSDVTIDNMESNTKNVYAIQGDIITVRHSSFTGRSLFANRRLLVDTCLFQGAGPSFIGSMELTNSVVVAGPLQDTIEATSSDPDHPISRIFNNTFIGGTVHCDIQTADPFTKTVFKNNIFYQQDAFVISTPNRCTYDYNLITPTRNLGGNGNTTGDPMFVDINNHDIHLKRGSAAIDAADPLDTTITRDFDGTHRPQGTRSDIGAFEYVPLR